MKTKLNEMEEFLTENIKFLESYIVDGDGNEDVTDHLNDLKRLLSMLNE